MGIREVDLTLESIFARKTNPADLIRGHYHYNEQNGDQDGRNRIFPNNNGMIRIMTDFQLASTKNSVFFDDSDKRALDDSACADLHGRIFGKYPKWMMRLMPYVYLEEAYGRDCHRCGKILNPINRGQFELCKKCDDDMDEERLPSIF